MIFRFLTFSKDVILRGSILWKSIFIAFWVFAFWCLTAPYPASAMVVRLKKEVNPISKKGGNWEADILIKDKRVKNATAMGEWRVLKDKKSVFFTLTHIKKGDDYHTIKEQPSAKENVARNQTFKKGRRIILGGENDNEISQILGLDKKTYSATKKGGESGSGTGSGGGGADGDSSSSSLGGGGGSGVAFGNGDDTLASNGVNGGGSSNGGGSNGGGSDNGVIGGGGNNNNGGNNNGGSGIVPLPPFGGGDGSGGGVDLPIGGGGTIGGGGSNGDSGGGDTIIGGGDNGSNGGGDNNGGGNGDYSSQYCKPPQKRGNEMFLSVIDKAGNCLELKANRDDTKCEYRYDFGNRKAIKQTQFYYVDLENVTQNIGGCVDLEPEGQIPHRYELYLSDNKCKLNVTEDKDYAGGMVFEFQQQILFRGADGMVHIARDCGDYAVIKEELIDHRYDEKTQTLYRIVNRYYEDPFYKEPNGKPKKMYIAKGVESPYKFQAREFLCGKWEHDDKNLQSTRKTQIRAYDEISEKYKDLTGCDYTTDGGKRGMVTMPYTKVEVKEQLAGEIEEDPKNKKNNGIHHFIIEGKEVKASGDKYWLPCFNPKPFGGSFHETMYWTRYDEIKPPRTIAKWSVEYSAIAVGQTTRYQRPKQDDEEEGSYYEPIKQLGKWERKIIKVEKNEANLDATYLRNYEITQGFWQNPEIMGSDEYLKWKGLYHREKEGSYNVEYIITSERRTHKPDQGRCWLCTCEAYYATNALVTAIKSDYIFPKPATKETREKQNKKTVRELTEDIAQQEEEVRKKKAKLEKLERMREYEKVMKGVRGEK